MTESYSRSGIEQSENAMIDFESLSNLTGFPVELIKKELELDENTQISLADLRDKMLLLIDKSMLGAN